MPRRLKEINDPPKKIYIAGKMPDEDWKWLAIVGSRKFSPYGKSACENLIASLAGKKVVIVSGLALGIDSIAHRSALSANLPTIAVPGSGLDKKVLYPSTSRKLAEDIIDSGGALLSEFEPDFKATEWSFPKRNRIMAGLSDAVLVIEAEKYSGTLITSRLASEYNRDVLAVPGSIFSSSSAGPHMLIKNGAGLIDSPEALYLALDLPQEKKPDRNYSDCSIIERKIIEILSSEPKQKNEIIDTIDAPLTEINSALSVLEIKGLIKEKFGEMYLA